MSHLLIQMAQEMNRRASKQGAGDPSQSSGQGSASGSRKEMKMDEKWIPSMPIASWKNWTSRGKELSGFKSWLEQFSGWLCLIHDAYGQELREAINSADPIRSFRNHDQTMRSKRLFHLLQQNFTGYSKIENLIKSQISALGITESNGFELLRLIRKEFSLLSRSEALGYREQCIRFRVKKSDHLPDIVREVQTDIESFHSMLEASVIAAQLQDVRISEGDQYLLYEESAWKSARVSSIASKCHDRAAAFPWSSGFLYQNQSSRRHGFNSCDTACGKARCQGQDMLSTVERRAIWPRIVQNPRSAAIVARRVI